MITKELFERYVGICDADPLGHGTFLKNFTKKLEYENTADLKEDMYIYGVLFGDSEVVKQLYQMTDDELEAERKNWADEAGRFKE